MHKVYTHQGIKRIFYATRYSIDGFRFAYREAAFRQELILSIFLVVLTFFLDISKVEQILLVASLVFVLIVEVLNSAIEAVVDRFGSQWNEFSKMAKDMASAAVFLSIGLAIFVWIRVLV
ncbi:diacylglycerol kinase [Celerinatantimonas sp. MCCC 1A17872]|uniref:diacylglycerol kinase n=1 Tax=Celerinatantimonas sp. MCCC 1A17872 TaxID=3177514 RepID=UPI0038C82A1B